MTAGAVAGQDKKNLDYSQGPNIQIHLKIINTRVFKRYNVLKRKRYRPVFDQNWPQLSFLNSLQPRKCTAKESLVCTNLKSTCQY